MPSLKRADWKRLVSLNRKLSAILGFDAVPRRDPRTGSYTAAGSLTPDAVRAAWSIPPRAGPFGATAPALTGRAAFKAQLLAALRKPVPRGTRATAVAPVVLPAA